MSIKPWKILDSEQTNSHLRIDKCELPNGRIIDKMVLEFGTWATIVAITKDQKVVLIKQYRHGIGKIIWEFPGGAVEKDETALQAARRELLEESGFGGGNWVESGIVSPNPDNHTNMVHTFLAQDVERLGPQDLDTNEEIDVYLVPLAEVIRMAQAGELLQAMQVSALFFALAHLNRIR